MRSFWFRKFKNRFVKAGYKELVLVTGSTTSPNSSQITKDLTRTAPGFINLEWLMFRLERVLTMYSLRNPTLGYTQSMNFIAAVFLAATGSESLTFWAMAEFCEVLLPDYFVGDLLGVRADCALMQLLLQQKSPSMGELSRELNRLEIDLVQLCAPWLMTAFAGGVFPTETTLRIWCRPMHATRPRWRLNAAASQGGLHRAWPRFPDPGGVRYPACRRSAAHEHRRAHCRRSPSLDPHPPLQASL